MFSYYKYAGGPVFEELFDSSRSNTSGSMYSVKDPNEFYAEVGENLLSYSLNDSNSKELRAAGHKYGVGLNDFYKSQAEKLVSLSDKIKQPEYSGGTDQGKVPELKVSEAAVAAVSDDEALPPAPKVEGKSEEEKQAAWVAYGEEERAVIARNTARGKRREELKKPTEAKAPKAKAAEATEAKAKSESEGDAAESEGESESESDVGAESSAGEAVDEAKKIDISEKLGQDKFKDLSPTAAKSPLNRARFILTANIVGSSARVELLKTGTKPRLVITVKSEEAKQDRMRNFKGFLKSESGKEMKTEDPNTYALYKYLARGTPFVTERAEGKPKAASAASAAVASLMRGGGGSSN